MIGGSSIGPDSQVERILSKYGLEATSWGDDLLEDDTNRLLLALLLEQRGENALEAIDHQPDDSQEAGYFVTEEPLPVVSTNEDDQMLNWGFPASTVTIWGFTEPVYVAFRGEGANRKIPLTPSESPFTLSTEGGVNASSIWVRKPDSSTNDTQIKILALQ